MGFSEEGLGIAAHGPTYQHHLAQKKDAYYSRISFMFIFIVK